MADIETDASTQDAAEGEGGETGQPEGQAGGHHSQRQPRDEGKRFAGAPAAPTPPNRFKRTVKRNGKEEEEEADEAELWAARDQLAAVAHKDRASTDRFQRASAIARDAQSAREVATALANKDFRTLGAYFAQNKLNPKEALADLLDAAIQDEEMSDEQRELVQLRGENAARKEADRRREEDAETQAFMGEVDKLRPQVQRVWSHALEQSGLPKSEKMLETTARIFLEAADAGSNLSPEQVVELARWELVEANGALVNELEPTQFVKHFAGLSKKIDDSMTPEDFEKSWPALAKRYHRMLFARLRGGGTTRGEQPGTTRPPAQSRTPKNGRRELTDPIFDTF